ncbi:(p)ppGpp synthetase [Echinicola sp. CAU 1574]|uniref:(P)ppGpp synthetase n=1 Tax=Echinicola arenosa TaxID=2774144 RepID=A0ABR9ANB1_9BACT|nr:(p)ppGpp synthetase [Echinicola arenosa]MBD8489109.1 (p)ppGpp synthetase [Echinicola arenosa]
MNEIDKRILEFKTWYDAQLQHHDASVEFFCKLIGAIPKVEMVKGRTKSYDECISKFNRKYLPFIDKKEKEVKISYYLTDLIGIRAVCFYAEEVYEIRRGLRKYFKELEITDKSSQLEKTEDKFGYKSLHLQLVLKRGLKGIDGADKFKDIQIELQIRTVIQDAWSVLDHIIKYKKSIPQGLKRRINRLSALFEIADDEFSNIQKEILKEENKINYRLKKGGRIETLKTLDVFRFLFVALKYFPDYDFVEFKVDGFVQEILLLKSDFTEGALNEALQENLSYVDTIEKSINQHLNPYTKIRYCLYKYNIKKFKPILSEHQQGIFNTLG